MIIEPVAQIDESSSSEGERVKKVVPYSPIKFSSVDKSSLLFPDKWEESFSSPLRREAAIVVQVQDEEESEQEFIQYSASKDRSLFAAVLGAGKEKTPKLKECTIISSSPPVSPNQSTRYRPLGLGRQRFEFASPGKTPSKIFAYDACYSPEGSPEAGVRVKRIIASPDVNGSPTIELS